MTLTDAAVDTLAAWRLTRLVTSDALTQGVRDHVQHWDAERSDPATVERRYGADVAAEGGPFAYLVHCPICASVWVALGVALARRAAPLWWSRTAKVLATSAAICWLAERE